MRVKIGFIGAGNMGGALIAGVCRHYKVFVCEKDSLRARKLQKKFKVTVCRLGDLLRQADIVILAVKPQEMEGVLNAISAQTLKGKIFISIAAGITLSYLERKLGPGAKVIRTMPNLPALVGQGVTSIAGGRLAGPRDVAVTRKVFSHVGLTVVVPERQMDAVTAVSGSGPAYVFLFAECMMRAARSLGLNAALSRELVEETLSGSAGLLVRQKEEAGALRAQVTSKGGTTQAAMDVFLKSGLTRIFKQALQAARRRSRELSKR